MQITLIAAVARNGAIGFQNKLLYWLPNDLRRFKSLTTDHTIIMGRKTFLSLPKGALPNRRNVVLSRSLAELPGAEVFDNMEQALESCSPEEQVYVIGGESLYRQAISKADRLCLTLIDDLPANADAFFPEFTSADWTIESEEEHPSDEKHTHPYKFVDLVRNQHN